ncbi:C10 family peptidase [Candidatus Neomarinimicrobiota bacterium]
MIKKIFIIWLLLFNTINILFSKSVDVNTAKKIAKNWHQYRILGPVQPIEIDQVKENRFNQKLSHYLITFKDSGFVIVSGDDAVTPILGYSSKAIINEESIPPALQDLLDYYSQQIDAAITMDLDNQETLPLWNDILDYEFYQSMDSYEPIIASDVSPLLSTTWNQGCYYNEFCPVDAGGQCNHVWAGCVATAMAQIMKYWSHPEQGVGSHSYFESDYGTLSANFGATTYNWAGMPNSISTYDSDVAELIYHCGVSVEMDYGPLGSAAYTSHVVTSLETFFDYSLSTQYINKSSYTETEWNNILRNELDNNRPMQYRGSSSDGESGHSFNCDGYQGDDYFHFNWGWGASYDGYFYLNDLTPGTRDYSYFQSAIIGIEPAIPFVSEYQILIVMDEVGSPGDTEYIDYYTNALDANGYLYDIWDTYRYGTPSASLLDNYHDGLVIWYSGWQNPQLDLSERESIATYLDNGGKLFYNDQDLGYYVSTYGGMDWYNNYFYSTFIQDGTGLYAVLGVNDDAITNSLNLDLLDIYGGWWPSEIDPLPPAESIFYYDPSATTSALSLMTNRKFESRIPSVVSNSENSLRQDDSNLDINYEKLNNNISLSVTSSGSAGIKVDTGVYKLVYLAFGFETISDESSRAVLMDNIIKWLSGTSTGDCTSGSIIYNTETNTFNFCENGVWVEK